MNVRFSSLPRQPPPGWNVKSYFTGVPLRRLNPTTMRALYPPGRAGWALRALVRQLLGMKLQRELGWLARIVSSWRPQIFDTFALNGAGLFWLRVLEQRPITVQPR